MQAFDAVVQGLGPRRGDSALPWFRFEGQGTIAPSLSERLAKHPTSGTLGGRRSPARRAGSDVAVENVSGPRRAAILRAHRLRGSHQPRHFTGPLLKSYSASIGPLDAPARSSR